VQSAPQICPGLKNPNRDNCSYLDKPPRACTSARISFVVVLVRAGRENVQKEPTEADPGPQ
jgi:hypothetical protein